MLHAHRIGYTRVGIVPCCIDSAGYARNVAMSSTWLATFPLHVVLMARPDNRLAYCSVSQSGLARRALVP